MDRKDLGVVYDVSGKGLRLMTEALIAPGDRIAMNLRLPNQVSSMVVELATVRWGKRQTYGVEFENLSPIADRWMKKFMSDLLESAPQHLSNPLSPAILQRFQGHSS